MQILQLFLHISKVRAPLQVARNGIADTKKGPFRIFPRGSFLAGADADGQGAVAEADGRKLSFFSYTLYYIMWRVAASRCPDGRADGWGGLR